MSSDPSERARLTDSPYYWTYLFCTVGLILLVFMGPKIRARQAQIEQKYQGRQRAIQHLQGVEPSTPVSSPDRTQIVLGPLFASLGVILCVAWIRLWWTHFRPGFKQPTAREAR